MSKRPSAIFAVLAALSLGTPAVMADHGHGDSKNDHGNKHSDSDDDRGWERRDGYEFRTYGGRDGRPSGWSRGRKPAGEIAVYLPAKPRSTAAGATPIRAFRVEQGQIIVRRPLIEVHGSIDVVP
jgi:hypothetical protein